jgi:hypothetical protein
MKIKALIISCLLSVFFIGEMKSQILHDFIPFVAKDSKGAPRHLFHACKKDDAGNYFFLMNDGCRSTLLGDFELECIEWEDPLISYKHVYIVKVTPDFKIDTFANISGLGISQNFDLTVCNGNVYFSYNNWYKRKDTILIVGDTLLFADEGYPSDQPRSIKSQFNCYAS